MLAQQRIQELIKLPKTIVSKRPRHGYQEENGNRRCDLELRSQGHEEDVFEIFIRQNVRFIENFSIGLRYRADSPLGTITLVRYNGPHGESSRAPDGHYAKPHIHRVTELIVPICHEDGTIGFFEDMVDIYLQESPRGEAYIRICDFGMVR